ncbi:MAG: tRNA (adenosine(37)-N6)-threonylcarbamoyltransferase complex ATPase subunit type 1 TsaE [Tepidisphaeraceae bacterium]|jgi:tRNA threonylcarbamoyladenosine biosynthesis protein TsaE
MGTPIVIIQSESIDQTMAIAADLAAQCRGGEVIALSGHLGAGKTQFVRGLVRGLGAQERRVSSPTFVLLNIYSGGRLTVYHLDAYRVGGAEDFEAIGFEELLEQGGIIAVEWADRVKSLLPQKRIEVNLEAAGESARVIRIEWRDGSSPPPPPAGSS